MLGLVYSRMQTWIVTERDGTTKEHGDDNCKRSHGDDELGSCLECEDGEGEGMDEECIYRLVARNKSWCSYMRRCVSVFRNGCHIKAPWFVFSVFWWNYYTELLWENEQLRRSRSCKVLKSNNIECKVPFSLQWYRIIKLESRNATMEELPLCIFASFYATDWCFLVFFVEEGIKISHSLLSVVRATREVFGETPGKLYVQFAGPLQLAVPSVVSLDPQCTQPFSIMSLLPAQNKDHVHFSVRRYLSPIEYFNVQLVKNVLLYNLLSQSRGDFLNIFQTGIHEFIRGRKFRRANA